MINLFRKKHKPIHPIGIPYKEYKKECKLCGDFFKTQYRDGNLCNLCLKAFIIKTKLNMEKLRKKEERKKKLKQNKWIKERDEILKKYGDKNE